MKLYVNIKIRKNQKLSTFLKKCYNLQNNNYFIYFTPTYYDSVFKDKQCGQANRSFEDIYSVVTTYYPECTKQVLAKELEKIIKLNFIKLLFCTDIKKWVFMKTLKGTIDIYFKYLFDYKESRLKLKKRGNGEYTYFDIMKLMGYSEEKCKLP